MIGGAPEAAEEVIRSLRRQYEVGSIDKLISIWRSDNEISLKCVNMKRATDEVNVWQHHASPCVTQQNAFAERIIGTLSGLLRSVLTGIPKQPCEFSLGFIGQIWKRTYRRMLGRKTPIDVVREHQKEKIEIQQTTKSNIKVA